VLDYPVSLISYFDSIEINISVIIIFIFSVALLWTHQRENFWKIFIFFIATILVSSAITYTLKLYIARPRPLAFFGIENVNHFYEQVYKNSFPSGHTHIAFAMCFFVFMFVKKYWLILALLAFGMGFERIYAGSHFPSDVFVGAIIGTLCAFIMVNVAKKFLEKRGLSCPH
jgi:undecaprenyl-diphosphatase